LALVHPCALRRVPWGLPLWLILVFLGLQPAFVRYQPRNVNVVARQAYRALEPLSVDVLMVGSSRTFVGVQPTIVTRLLDRPTYNYCYGGATMEMMYHDLAVALRHQQPSVVILAANPLHVTRPVSGAYVDGLAWPSRIPVALQVRAPAELPQALLPMLTNHTLWKDGLRVLAQRLDAHLSVDASELILLHATGLTGIMPNEEWSRTRDTAYQPVSPESHVYLQRALDLCRRRGVRFLLVNMPYLAEMGRRNVQVEDLAAEQGVPLRDLGVELAGTLRQVHWRDGVHLSEAGRLTCSLHMARILADELGWELDADAVAAYEALELRDVRIEARDALRIELIPEDEDAALEACWEVSGPDLSEKRTPHAPLGTIMAPIAKKGVTQVDIELRDARRPDWHEMHLRVKARS